MAGKAGGSAPKGGMQPKTKAPKAEGAARTKKMAKGAPTKGSGADTNPYSSARKSGR